MADSKSELLAPGTKVHFMGIGGYGINPIARVMHEMGYRISGCDMNESPLIPPLVELGIPVRIGHSPDHIDEFDLLPEDSALVLSSAIPMTHPEVQAAYSQGIRILKRNDVMRTVMKDKVGIAVAGTHGKTTTTAMIAVTLKELGLDPSYIIGGVPVDLGRNAKAGDGDHFVIEADEYDNMFLGIYPKVAIVTSLEFDHPDQFEDIDEVRRLFQRFIANVKEDGLVLAAHDVAQSRRLIKRRMLTGQSAITYGMSGGSWRARDVKPNEHGGMDFNIVYLGFEVGRVSLRVPGIHNVQNALVAVAAITEVTEIKAKEVAEALSNFRGVQRRFELKGEVNGVVVIDDYAHHPTAIRSTLDAARRRYPGKTIWAVWQPHTYSRTAKLLDDFVDSFSAADHVIVTDIFRSRDKDTFELNGAQVVDKMAHHPDAKHISGLTEATAYLSETVKSGAVVIVMSAGDATRISSDLVFSLQERTVAS
ncbi:MAG: UDP-N-acetylmuramate--L-alanine ligase [Chloroflexi bacterium]|nr:UDP-N-acetylmuramate--L-alanine ligase [Chloroflexota bacterium]